MLSVHQQLRDHLQRKVFEIGGEAADASDTNVPTVLLGLGDLMNGHASGENLEFVRATIWDAELIDACIVCLRQDFSKVEGSWQTAGKLAVFVTTFVCQFKPKVRQEHLTETLVPKTFDNLIVLARRVQTRYEMIASASASYAKNKELLLSTYRTLCECIKKIVINHPGNTLRFLESDFVLKMLITEEPQTLELCIDLIEVVARSDKVAIKQMDNTKYFSLLDELIYKLIDPSTTPSSVGAVATRTLVTLSELHPPTADAFFTRYKGIRYIVTRWTGRGFGTDQQRLLNVLDAQTRHMGEMERFHRAARTVQRVYRGWRERKRLAKADATFKKLHQSYRKKRAEDELRKRRDLEERDLKRQLMINRQRNLRMTQEKQLDMLESVPALQVDRYLQKEEVSAAKIIQTRWRGHTQLKEFQAQRDRLRVFKSTILIQRWVRRCLFRIGERRLLRQPWKGVPGLTEERRDELQELVNDRRERSNVKQLGSAEKEDLHQRAQDMLAAHLGMIRKRQRDDHKRDMMLARLDADSSLLLDGAPDLSEATMADVNLFLSPVAPIALAGKTAHNECLRQEALPWYQKLDAADKLEDVEELLSERVQIEKAIDRQVKYVNF